MRVLGGRGKRGVIGHRCRELVARPRSDGHDTSHPGPSRRLGRPRLCNALDAAGLRRGAAAERGRAAHLTARRSASTRAAAPLRETTASHRGTRNCRGWPAGRFVCQSVAVAYLPHRERGVRRLRTLFPSAPPFAPRPARCQMDGWCSRLTPRPALRLVLRPGTYDGGAARRRSRRRRLFPVIGEGSGLFRRACLRRGAAPWRGERGAPASTTWSLPSGADARWLPVTRSDRLGRRCGAVWVAPR